MGNANTACAQCGGADRKAAGLEDPNGPAATAGGREWNDEEEEDGAPTEREVSVERMKELKELFEKVDRDQSGEIERGEIVKLVKELYTPSEAEVDEFRSRFDADGNGTLDLDEFTDVLKRHHSRYGTEKYASKVRALFRKHANADGVVSDIPAVVRELLEVPPSVQRRAMEILDADGDGSVTFDEFAGSVSRLMDALEQIWKESKMPEEVRVQRDPSFVLTRQQKRRLQQLKDQAKRRRKVAAIAAGGLATSESGGEASRLEGKYAGGADFDVL